jgi:hypothetical protein
VTTPAIADETAQSNGDADPQTDADPQGPADPSADADAGALNGDGGEAQGADPDGTDGEGAADANADADPESGPSPLDIAGLWDNEETRGKLLDLPGFREHLANVENTAAQKRETDLRRQASSKEATRVNVRTALERAGVELGEDSDPRVQQQLDALYVMGEENSLIRLMRDFGKAAAEQFGYGETELAAVQTAIDTFEGDDLSGYTGALFQNAVEAQKAAWLKTARLKDVQESLKGTPLWEDLEAWKGEEVETEVRARDIEKNPQRPSGERPASGGRAPASKLEQYRGMTSDQLAALPDAEYDEAKRLLFETE